MFLAGDVERIQAPLYKELDTMGIRMAALEERVRSLEETKEAHKPHKPHKPLKSVGSVESQVA